MKSVALHNLGCKVNSYEIEVMQQMLQEKGYTIVPFDEIADIYIVNHLHSYQYCRPEKPTDASSCEAEKSGGTGSGSGLLCADRKGRCGAGSLH